MVTLMTFILLFEERMYPTFKSILVFLSLLIKIGWVFSFTDGQFLVMPLNHFPNWNRVVPVID